MEKIQSLKGKTVAIVGMGRSWHDYNLAKSHGIHFDEVWAINSVASVIFHDRVFMMDPPSRFLESDDAGGQTDTMRKLLTNHDKPIYSCIKDERCPAVVEYPIHQVVRDSHCYYLNNTVAYAIAFAYWNEVGNLKLFGIDFSYKGNLHFAEAGRGCCEFWLDKCMHKNIQVEVANSSALLDSNEDAQDKLYGYHRLKDPMVVVLDEEKKLKVLKKSEYESSIVRPERTPIMVDRNDPNVLGEPKKW
tara:strand:+ start:546 stop:1283 length:738 start_codon:yes stop_codon:yes gene_type:complete